MLKIYMLFLIALIGSMTDFAHAGLKLPEHLNIYKGGFRGINPDQIERIRLLDHSKSPEMIFLSSNVNNIDFIKTVRQVIADINSSEQQESPIKLVILQSQFKKFFEEDHLRIILSRKDLDQWLRDFGKIVAVKLFNKEQEEYAVLDLNRGRGLEGFSLNLAQSLDIGHIEIAISSIPGNYGGNIDVTPNGVLYMGNTAEDNLVDFFKEKGYMNSHAVLSTNWLQVGHVDELISTLVLPKEQKDPCGFALVAASPKLALSLLEKNQSSSDEDLAFFSASNNINASFVQKEEMKKYGKTLKFLQDYISNKKDIRYISVEASSILRAQNHIQNIIDHNIQTLKAAIVAKSPACHSIKVVEYPTLFKCSYSSYKNTGMNGPQAKQIQIQIQTQTISDPVSGVLPNFGSIKNIFYTINAPLSDIRFRDCHAYLPGSVNMTVLRNHLLIPDPFYRPFRNEISKQSVENGQVPHLINDMSYHLGTGEIHCGTNCLSDIR